MKNICTFIFVGLLCYPGLLAQAQPDNGLDLPIRNIPDFADVESQLQVLVNINGFHKENNFCIVAQKDDGSFNAEVYWPTEGKMILWEPQDNNYSLIASRDYIDLKTDVVPNARDITLKYMILPWTRADVNQWIEACHRYGDTYKIYKTEDGWVPIKGYSQFSNVLVQLQTLVDQQGHKKHNTFYVIGQKNKYYIGAYVYWREEERLIYWLPDPYDFQDPLALTSQFGDLDLRKGIRNFEDGNKFIYEMPQKYVEEILHVCLTKGQLFQLAKTGD